MPPERLGHYRATSPPNHADPKGHRTSKIDRWKDRSEYTAEEHLQFARDGTRPENDDYRQARTTALENAGLDDTDTTSKTVDDMTTEDHLQRLQRERGI